MRIIAFDTSNSFCSVGSYFNGILQNKYSEKPNVQTSSLIPLIQELLLGSTMKDLDYIISTNGPGSFTGVRIGLAASIGFKIANPLIPVVTINTLAATYVNFLSLYPDVKRVLVVNDAPRDEVYYQYFYNMSPLSAKPLLSNLNEIPETLKDSTVIGNSLYKAKEMFHNYILIEKIDMSLVAKSFAEDKSRINNILFNIADNIHPIYLREPTVNDKKV